MLGGGGRSRRRLLFFASFRRPPPAGLMTELADSCTVDSVNPLLPTLMGVPALCDVSGSGLPSVAVCVRVYALYSPSSFPSVSC